MGHSRQIAAKRAVESAARAARGERTPHNTPEIWTDEADPQKLLDLVRGSWAIETKQHYRRDHTQREDHCLVRHPVAARNLSLMRSAAMFLYEHQRPQRDAKKSLPNWQRKNIRNPNPLIQQSLPTPEGRLDFPQGLFNVPSGARARLLPAPPKSDISHPNQPINYPILSPQIPSLGGLPQVV